MPGTRSIASVISAASLQRESATPSLPDTPQPVLHVTEEPLYQPQILKYTENDGKPMMRGVRRLNRGNNEQIYIQCFNLFPPPCATQHDSPTTRHHLRRNDYSLCRIYIQWENVMSQSSEMGVSAQQDYDTLCF